MKKIILDGHEIEISDESFEAFKKQFIKPSDRAEKNEEKYYYIDDEGVVDWCYDDYDSVDNYRYNTGNYYLTKKEAERAVEIQNILLKYKYKFSKEELEDVTTKKWYIYGDNYDKKLIVGCCISYPINTTYFETEEDAQKVINEIGYDDFIYFCVQKGIK